MKVCNSTCVMCSKRFYGYGSDMCWALCPWCRYRHYARIIAVEIAWGTMKGFGIGAGFFLAGLIVRLFFVREPWR